MRTKMRSHLEIYCNWINWLRRYKLLNTVMVTLIKFAAAFQLVNFLFFFFFVLLFRYFFFFFYAALYFIKFEYKIVGCVVETRIVLIGRSKNVVGSSLILNFSSFNCSRTKHLLSLVIPVDYCQNENLKTI